MNLTVSFLNQQHKVLVSIASLTSEPRIHIHFMDSFIKSLCGVEHIRYTGWLGYKLLSLQSEPILYFFLKTLAGKIKEKIEEEIQETTPDKRLTLAHYSIPG